VIKIPFVYVHSHELCIVQQGSSSIASSSNPGTTGAHTKVGTKDSKHYKKRKEAKKQSWSYIRA